MTSVDEILNARSREHLMAILDYFRMPLNHSRSKRAMVRDLSRFLHDDPMLWLGNLTEMDLLILRDLDRRGPETPVTFPRGGFSSTVEVLQIVETIEGDDYEVTLSLPTPIYELIHGHVDEVIAAKEADGSFLVEHLILGCLNIYGVVPLRTFVDMVFRDIKSESGAAVLGSKIADNPYIRICQEEYRGEYYIVSPFISDFEEILEMRRISFKSVRKYGKMNVEQAVKAGENAPLCAYGLDSEEGKNLVSMLESLGYEGDELDQAVHTVWFSAQYAIDEDATEMLFSPVTSCQDSIESFAVYSECINTITEYANSIPKWLLKGKTSEEAGMMKLTIRVNDLADGYSADPGLELYNLGLAVKPVDPDDPCPCGSGLSYRFCHGKYIS